MRKNSSIDREKNLKFEAEGQKCAKMLRSLEQFVRTVKCQNNFCFSDMMNYNNWKKVLGFRNMQQKLEN